MKLLEMARIGETIELQLTEAYWGVLPPAIAEKRKMELLRVGGALLSITPKSTSLQRNRVLGLGLNKPATREMIDEILDHFRAARVTRFSFHVSPSRQSDEITDWLKTRDFTLHHSYVKLIRKTSEPGFVKTGVAAKQINKDCATQFVEVFSKTFPQPQHQRAWLKAAIGQPGFSHFMAYNSGRPVATGMLYTNGDRAWMGGAGTLTRFRRQGAHSALIAARVRRAAELGAKWIVCATLQPVPRRPSGSYRNLLKQGFEVGYSRPIWVWERR